MTSRKRTRERMLAHCDEINDDDLIDPRTYFTNTGRSSNRKENRKAQQLCRQVAQTLDLCLSDDGRVPLLTQVSVGSVQPAPDSSRLLVTLVADGPLDAERRSHVEQAVNQHGGRLRCAVAAAIHRRKTPTLVFRVLAAPEWDGGSRS